ncbi:hypothetical protein C772_00703 [Bhargavaea cecembensis DSE10]|uniref:Uncharacterized protein n=1 Tax=Bhargavaea cecembensis DSE10 TaxID=1235279 RepID=M7NER4_9BACL|nr:hypothetical protein C772_00703 [Bhargavaea cecembensis DSE10]
MGFYVRSPTIKSAHRLLCAVVAILCALHRMLCSLRFSHTKKARHGSALHNHILFPFEYPQRFAVECRDVVRLAARDELVLADNDFGVFKVRTGVLHVLCD